LSNDGRVLERNWDDPIRHRPLDLYRCTTMAALGHGVPLLCTPIGRDQFFNAERVQALGAGRMGP
jgi:hypothetical protein